MKKYFALFVLFISCNSILLAQVDSDYNQNIELEIDTASLNQKNREAFSFKEKAEVLVSSIFGQSRKLKNADSIINTLDSLPSFGAFKDNYIILGTELLGRKDENNSDVKFQVSIKQRLTNSTLPFKTYMFLTYTQQAFWDVFKESMPFRDLSFNPSVGIGKILVYRNRMLGLASLQLEHESNGRDGDNSRSWNRLTFSSMILFSENWSVYAQAWIPIIDGANNKDIVKYRGWSNLSVNYTSPRKKYIASALLNKRSGSFWGTNLTLRFAIRLFTDDNQYLFTEYYNGYGETLLDYKRHTNKIRLGIVIKPTFF